jgi:hypothetical protein
MAGICPLDDNLVAVQNVQYQARTNATVCQNRNVTGLCVTLISHHVRSDSLPSGGNHRLAVNAAVRGVRGEVCAIATMPFARTPTVKTVPLNGNNTHSK